MRPGGVFDRIVFYGSTPEGTDESYTAQEYRAVREADVPRLAFLSGEGEFYPGYFREPDAAWQKQQSFREAVSEDRLGDSFGEPEELARKVVTAIANWAAKNETATRTRQDTTVKANVEGSGAVAQGIGSVAAGEGSVAIGGDVHGDVHVSTSGPTAADDSELRNAYLSRVMERCGYVSLAGVDPAIAGKQDAERSRRVNSRWAVKKSKTTLHRTLSSHSMRYRYRPST